MRQLYQKFDSNLLSPVHHYDHSYKTHIILARQLTDEYSSSVENDDSFLLSKKEAFDSEQPTNKRYYFNHRDHSVALLFILLICVFNFLMSYLIFLMY
jgi:hypothetical protein